MNPQKTKFEGAYNSHDMVSTSTFLYNPSQTTFEGILKEIIFFVHFCLHFPEFCSFKHECLLAYVKKKQTVFALTGLIRKSNMESA